MIENKTEVEIILKNGRLIVMHCEKFEVTSNNVLGCITKLEYSLNSDLHILYIDTNEIVAIIQKLPKEGTSHD